MVGARMFDSSYLNEGRVFLYYGSSSGLNPTPAWTFNGGWTNAYLGEAVSTAGDINSDGYSDVVIGREGYSGDQSSEGAVYVFYGSKTGLPASPDLTLEGNLNGAYLGTSVGAAGDVNGDGYGDVIAGAYNYSNGQSMEGAVYIYHGSSTGLLPDPTIIESDFPNANTGGSVDTAGDVNGDGYSDVVVGTNLYDNGEDNEGAVYLYYGSASGVSPAPAWMVQGNQFGSELGRQVSAAGDVNGDGFGDVVAGNFGYSNVHSYEGAIRVYYGGSRSGKPLLPRQIDDASLNPVAALGRNSGSTLALRLNGRTFWGRDQVKMEWQIAPVGVPFTATTGVIHGLSAMWTDVPPFGTVLDETIAGLAPVNTYHWRLRLVYKPGNPAGLAAGRWVSGFGATASQPMVRTFPIYVNQLAGGANNGSSWANAFTSLQTALGAANPGDEIWVAWANGASYVPGGSVTATFQLVDGVALYGGFNGFETLRSERTLAPTLLSGEFGVGNHVYHVVSGSGLGAGTALDGFRITGGSAT
ncbi:MAG: hypothetical protein EHM35_17220, partial [Planctomycetaceae bacterium]